MSYGDSENKIVFLSGSGRLFQEATKQMQAHPADHDGQNQWHVTRDMTKSKFEFKRWRISNNFTTAFDIRRMLKLPSLVVDANSRFVYIPQNVNIRGN